MPATLYLVCYWRLEPYAGKLACTVLRGRGAGDSLLLPDQREGNIKTPHYIQTDDQSPFAFAGLYELYKDELLSCTILTTSPNKLMSKLHDRMPVILSPDDYERWLEPNLNQVEDVEDLLQPYAGKMQARPVSHAVNTTRNDGPALI